MDETLEQAAIAPGVCPMCPHFDKCRAPCAPVAEYLRRDNLTVFEKTHTDPETGETVSIIFSRSRELPESDLPQVFEDTGRPADQVQRVFNTDAENPFAGFVPSLKQTGVFIDRFFHKLSYEDLGVKYEMSSDNARKTYHNAVKRVLEILKTMDDKPLDLSHYKKRIEERSGKIPKGQKWFLLNKLFGIMPSEIAKMEGLPERSSSVRQLIIRVSDQLRAGEIRLIDATPEEAAAAKLRLDEHRGKRRGRFAKK